MKFFSIMFSAALVVTSFCAACATGPVNIPDEITAAELIQRGQEASDRNRYNHALQYYQALLDRNLTNIDLVCAAEYEIAFVHYKQKKYDEAKTEFNALLERYNTPDEELLPQQFKTLSNIMLERMAEREKKRTNPLSSGKKKTA
jgi:outer membrane protein assembly factor BamD (BamD/ComL family)